MYTVTGVFFSICPRYYWNRNALCKNTQEKKHNRECQLDLDAPESGSTNLADGDIR